VLGGETDCAVGLQRRPGCQQRGVGSRSLGRTDIAGGVGGLIRQRQGRAVDQRAGQFEGDVHIGELVLDRLIRADDPTELGALLGVFDRGVQQGLASADQLRGGGQCAELVGAGDIGLPR